MRRRPGLHSWWVRAARCVRAGLAAALLALPGVPGLAQAQGDEGWVLRQADEAGSTRVWLRPRPEGVPAFRATTVIDARLSSLAAVLLDAGRTREWVYRVREAVPLRTDGPARGVTLVVTALPFPLSDRESVVAWQMTQDPQSLAVTLSGHAAEDAPPPHPQRVRMPEIASRWVLTPRADGRVDVLFEGVGDPGGNLAGPLLRQFVEDAIWQAPWHTIRALHEIVRQPPFPDATLAFIREPAR